MLVWHWWGSTRLQQLFHQIELNTSLGLVLNDREITQHIIVSNVAGQGVTMLICEPLILGGVGMS